MKLDLFQKYKLSKREIEILSCLINGCSYKTIASILKISPSTVDSHVSNIRLKTGTTSKEKLIVFFKQNGFVPVLEEVYESITKSTDKEQSENYLNHNAKTLHHYIRKPICLFVVLICILVAFSWIYRSYSRDKCSIGCKQSGYKYVLERNNLVNKLNEYMLSSKKISILALVGHGGSGKTTIARRYLQNANYDFVYEIKAENTSSIKESFISLAYDVCDSDTDKTELQYALSIKNEKERIKRVRYFVQHKLKQFKNWLLLFDNVEDTAILTSYCPTSRKNWGNGDVIITTRNFDIHEVNYLEKIGAIFIGELREEKIDLFRKIIGDKEFKDSEVKKFLKKIPSFPLDVVSAAYYIKNVGG